MKVVFIKMALDFILTGLKQLAPMTSTKVDDKIVREFERVKKQVREVLD